MATVMVYESVFLGITTSQWIIIILGVLWVFTLMIAAFLYTKLGPCEGYLWASLGKADDKNLGIVFENHSIRLKRLNYFSGVFDEMGLTWLARKPEQHRFGSCSAELIADYWGLSMDPKINVATKEFIDTWNSDLSAAACSSVNMEYDWLPEPEERKEITDFDSLYAAIERAPPSAAIRIRAFSYVPMYELLRYYPKNLSASDFTGYLEAMKKVDTDRSSSAASSYLPLICLVGGLLLGAGLMYFAH